MKWHSLLKDPTDIPQRINQWDESEDVMVVVRFIELYREKGAKKSSAKFTYQVLANPCYYGHWEANGDEGWRVRSKNYSDCGRFGGFDIDKKFSEFQENEYSYIKDDMDDVTPEAIEFFKNNAIDDGYSYLTLEIVGWAYYPNEDEFIEENKDLI